MKNKKLFTFILMHFGFLIYSLYSLFGKFASKYDFLSLKFCFTYCLLILILFIYAVVWQQVLKVFELSIAIANKAMTIIWGIIWSYFFFNEQITPKKIIAIIIIITGIVILSFADKNKNSDVNKEDNSYDSI